MNELPYMAIDLRGISLIQGVKKRWRTRQLTSQTYFSFRVSRSKVSISITATEDECVFPLFAKQLYRTCLHAASKPTVRLEAIPEILCQHSPLFIYNV